MAHTTVFCLMKRGTKLYMAIKMYLYVNPCLISVQAYVNRTSHMLNKIIDDEPVCVYVFVFVSYEF
jgi:hypothetical protein